jgi:hypothetical protein
MKAFTMIIIFLFFIMYLLSAAACIVFYKQDNGQLRGWYRSQKTVSPQKSMNHEKIEENPEELILEPALI